MAEATARFRLVKCPKCRNILTEFANVPVYKCGGCGATLRAKHSIAGGGNDAVGSVEKIPESITSAVSSLEKQMNSRCSDSKDGITEERSLNLCSSDRKIETPRRDESSEHQISDTATRDPKAKKENPDRKIQVEENECLNNQVEKSPKITRKEEASSRLSDRMNMSSRSKRSTANDDHRDVRAPNDRNRLSKSAFTRKEASDRLQEGVNMDYAKRMSLQLLRKKILIKVDELRDELDELLDKSAEARIRTRQITTKHQPSVNTPRRFRYTEDPVFARRSTNLHSQSRQFGSHSGDHAKERMHEPKEHFRPVLGGAPFVICHNCLKLLTVPTDLLVSGKQLRKLKCGSCWKILTFSYREGTHSSPRTPNNVAHPSSEVSSTVDVGTGSDAFDSRSFGISFSTEAEIAQHMLRDSSSNLVGSRVHRQITRTNEHVNRRGAKDEKGKGILIDY